MRYWRVRLELLGPFATPMISGTLFGHLCWAMVRRDGDDGRLRRLLERLGEEPILLSDVLPAELLPRPLIAAALLDRQEDAAKFKEQKRAGWVRREHFLAVRDRLAAAALTDGLVAGPSDREHRLAHNRIDRHRGTTPDQGGLYFADEVWPHHDDRWRDLYLAAAMPPAELFALLADIGEHGFGRDATYGRGRFRIEGHVEERVLFGHPGRRLLSLSHGCHDWRMVEPRWKLATHFGKVGAEALARGGRPWKRPILLMRSGATFAADGPGPFGAWLSGIYQDEGRLGFSPGHHAFHLGVPFTELP